ncbi:MAG: winged helix-turn-helix domain-containing tetratricopeptide repeat protein [Vicinamibacterales bacterium]
MADTQLRCGDVEIDLHLRHVRRGSDTIRLQDQPFNILALMLECPGAVVTREDICRRLWPDGTSVDFEHSVNAAIKRLRSALGDDANSPRYVETIPRRGYRFIAPIVAGGEVSVRRPPAARPRLVVLPFVNLSGEVSRDYFSDGLTEEMIAQLGRVCSDRIGVVARTSAMLYKNAQQAAGEIGEALKADYLVEGSVRIAGDRVRVTAQLIETRGETHLWANSYNRQLADCIAIQEELAVEIAERLTHTLFPQRRRAREQNPKAYELFLTGRFHWNKTGPEGLRDALRYYDDALAIDPEFGKAHAGRARVFVSLAEYYLMPSVEALEAARVAADAALELDPGESDALVARAEVARVLEWNWPAARATYQKAIELNPSSEAAHRYFAWFLGTRQPDQAALTAADRAFQLDPLCLTMGTTAAMLRYLAGDLPAALAMCRRILAMDPHYEMAHRATAVVLMQMERAEEALRVFDDLPDRDQPPASLLVKAEALACRGDHRGARALLGRVDHQTDLTPARSLQAAAVLTRLGENEAALERLDAAGTHRDPWVDLALHDPRFARLHGAPRFETLCARLRGTMTPSSVSEEEHR